MRNPSSSNQDINTVVADIINKGSAILLRFPNYSANSEGDIQNYINGAIYSVFPTFHDTCFPAPYNKTKKGIALSFIEETGRALLPALITNCIDESNGDLASFHTLFQRKLNSILVEFYRFSYEKVLNLGIESPVTLQQPNFLWPDYLYEKAIFFATSDDHLQFYQAALEIFLERAKHDNESKKTPEFNLHKTLTRATHTKEDDTINTKNTKQFSGELLVPGSKPKTSREIGYSLWGGNCFFSLSHGDEEKSGAEKIQQIDTSY